VKPSRGVVAEASKLCLCHRICYARDFTLALDLPADATRAQLLDAMKDKIVGKAAYVGRFRQ
jgi:hypothetical protein